MKEYNEIKVSVFFDTGRLHQPNSYLKQGDFNSTKMVFNFDRQDGIKALQMANEKGELVYYDIIENNEVILSGKMKVTTLHEDKIYRKYLDSEENIFWYEPLQNKLYDSEWVEIEQFNLEDYELQYIQGSLFDDYGYYPFEVVLFNNKMGKLTSVASNLYVDEKVVKVDNVYVVPSLPVIEKLIIGYNKATLTLENLTKNVSVEIKKLQDATKEVEKLDLDANKINKETTVNITKKDGTVQTVKILDGVSLQFMWDGTKLGIKTDKDENFVFVDLQGIQGPIGPQGKAFTIAKKYLTKAAMDADFDNMEINDYVMLVSSVEVQENAQMYTKLADSSEWVFVCDFSGATGIQGPIGKTPSISIGQVITFNPEQNATVTRTGTDENPIFNFGIPKGAKGDKPVKGEDYFTNDEKQQMVDSITQDANSDFNKNVTQKTNDFNQNAEDKTTAFDNHVNETFGSLLEFEEADEWPDEEE